jgi:ribosome biogenesis GTPase A
MNTIKRPALGETAVLGTLYDARRDRFLPYSILAETLPEGCVTVVPSGQLFRAIITTDTLKEKFDTFEMNPDLIASFLGGFLHTQGSGGYLNHSRETGLIAHRALLSTYKTIDEKLNFMGGDLKDHLELSILEAGHATHIVSEINWGTRSIIAATQLLLDEEDRTRSEYVLSSAFSSFDENHVPSQLDNSIKVTAYADLLEPGETLPYDMVSAHRHIIQQPNQVASVNNGAGNPLTYTLLPVSFFSAFFGASIQTEIVVRQPSVEFQGKLVDLLDELCQAKRLLSSYYQDLQSHRDCVERSHIAEVAARIRQAEQSESDLQKSYAQEVALLRDGQSTGQNALQLLEDFLNSRSAPAALKQVIETYSSKLKFVDRAVGSGATYVGYDGTDLDVALRAVRGNAYVFRFNSTVMSGDLWEGNVDLLEDILQDESRMLSVLIVDCDATGDTLDRPYISQINNSTTAVEDLFRQKKHLADKCLMRYDLRALDNTVTDAPAQRRAVRIPCPGPGCSSRDLCAWICFKCHAPVEYGRVDNFLYCDCGRTPYELWAFNCQGLSHGSSYEQYGGSKLQRLLRSLPPPPELNVLILGETGVGKSTFINSFVNYLTFTSLDEGLSAKKLNWIIPCSFSTQTVDPQTDKLVQQKISIGSDKDENDGMSGQSATQKAVVYPLYLDGTLVRLIDTPGIGVTRGIDQDRQNMVDILSVLRNYDKLHGILILLKPNNARLGVMFKFCVKELLTHLHRSAAHNMVFGFTNTRGSNFQPGDTFVPLQTLLHEYRDVVPSLCRDNVYCFDSESFRYLAAKKKGVEMGNLEDYRRSWEHSSGEAQRVLTYFGGLKPHQVQATLSLNETRYLIAQMIAPMAHISQVIADSITKAQKDADDLADSRLTGQELQQKLQIHQTKAVATPYDKPRTVCNNESCIRTAEGTGEEGTVILRKQKCNLC